MNNSEDSPIENLIFLAKEARKRAYAPYSNFKVGAALEATKGVVFLGCNVENVSLGLTMCAERVAVGAAVQAGVTHFRRIAIVADSSEPVVPCGACRQVLAEFGAELEVVSATLESDLARHQLIDLLPLPRQGILD